VVQVSADGGNGRAWHRLTSVEQTALTEAGYVRSWQPGEILALQGGPPNGMFVILRGWVKISAANDRGDKTRLATRGPGEIIGELGPISGLPRTATMQAIGEVRALVVPQERLLGVLRRCPRIAEELLRSTSGSRPAARISPDGSPPCCSSWPCNGLRTTTTHAWTCG
jgi:CRP/FNR family cyclic AMP-dependent transcriptional regulator